MKAFVAAALLASWLLMVVTIMDITLSTMPQSMLCTTLQSTLSIMPQLLPTQLPMLSTTLQLLPMLSMLLLPIMPQLQLTMLPQLTRLRNTPMRSLHTPSPTLLLMTTQSLTSTLRSSLMVPAMLPDLTLLLFPMAESNTSSTLPMDMMDMLLMSPMRVLLSTQRRNPTTLPQLTTPLPQLTTPLPSLCFVNIY